MPTREFPDQIAEWANWIGYATGARLPEEKQQIHDALHKICTKADPDIVGDGLCTLQECGAISANDRQRIEACGAAMGPRLGIIGAALYRLHRNS